MIPEIRRFSVDGPLCRAELERVIAENRGVAPVLIQGTEIVEYDGVPYRMLHKLVYCEQNGWPVYTGGLEEVRK